MAAAFHKWLLLLFSFVGLSANTKNAEAPLHPFYVSVTEINHNAADKNLEISCKIFTDDFETTLSKNYKTKVDLVNIKDQAQTDKQVADYIRKHLSLKLDGKPATIEFVGFERESEAVWSYFQVSNITPPKKIEVMNNLLYDGFDKQINVMHVAVGGNRKSTKLNYPDVNAKFEF